jgi:hypothetical protein
VNTTIRLEASTSRPVRSPIRPSLVASCTRGAPSLPGELIALEGVGTPGDVVLACVASIGAYPRVENLFGRDVQLRPGGIVAGVLGDRYSSTSIYGGVPDGRLDVHEGVAADLLAVGGIVGVAASSPARLGTPTRLELLGLAADPATPDVPVRLVPRLADTCADTPVVFVGGTAAEVGKTTFSSALVHRLAAWHGVRVGVTKLAGTGRLRDLLTLADAGAHCRADFVDAGLGTTYGRPDDVVAAAARYLTARLTDEGAELIVAELGGDLWAAGIPAILRDPSLRAVARLLVVVPSDTMASLGADTWLRESGIDIPTVHAVPHRNVMAARDRLSRGLGVQPVDPHVPDDLEALCDRLLDTGNLCGIVNERH